MFVLILLGVATVAFLFFAMKYTYWKRRNVPGPTPIPILGNYKDFFTYKEISGITTQKIYNQFPNEPYVGAYYATEPVLIPRDPEMIKTIMAKDFQYFSGRVLVDHEYRDPALSNNIFFNSGDNWKVLRTNLNPMFSSAKLKNMFQLIVESGEKLDKHLESEYKMSDVQDFKSIAMKYILEVIGTCVFGMQFDTMREGDNHIKKFADIMIRPDGVKTFKNNIREIWPTFYHILTNRNPFFVEGVTTFFFGLAKQSFESRGNKPAGRNDLVDLLLKFKEKGFVEGDGVRNASGEAKRVKIEASDSLLASQALLFFGAGFETSSSALSLALFELSKHPEVQQRLVDEIEEVLQRHDGKITYESIQELKYMDMVVSETTRKYPVLGIITREAVSDYKFADYDLKVEKGTRVHIPVWALHYDPKYYPQPEKFDPERFAPEEVRKRHPYTYLSFGEGQRVCIGMRLSKLQVAVGLIRILRRYRLEECERTARKLAFDPRGFPLALTTALEVRMVPRHC